MTLLLLALSLLSSQCMAQKLEFFGHGRCLDSQERNYEYWYLPGWKSQKLIYKHDLSECKCEECESLCPATKGCLGFHYFCCKSGARCEGGASLLFSKGTQPSNPPGNWSTLGPRGSSTTGPDFDGVGPITKLSQYGYEEETCIRQVPSAVDDDSFIREWNDVTMGIGFTMVSENGWRSGKWGVVPAPLTEYTSWAQTFVSIMTRDQPMAVYRGRPYGLAFHITAESNFWKDFQVVGHGRDQIVGGPGDGGSHTPGTPDWMLSMESQGKDYSWFTSQKNAILAKYNTVYGIRDYNEFITNGVRPSAVAGILKNERSSHSDQDKISERDLCSFLTKNVPERTSPWPVYGYDYGTGSLKIIKHLSCGGEIDVEAVMV